MFSYLQLYDVHGPFFSDAIKGGPSKTQVAGSVFSSTKLLCGLMQVRRHQEGACADLSTEFEHCDIYVSIKNQSMNQLQVDISVKIQIHFARRIGHGISKRHRAIMNALFLRCRCTEQALHSTL